VLQKTQIYSNLFKKYENNDDVGSKIRISV